MLATTRKAAGLFIRGALAAFSVCALLAASASASPPWKFNHSQLMTSETIVGTSLESALTIPGLTTKCEMPYKMTMENTAGTGKGQITQLALNNCTTNAAPCTVGAAAASGLPWPLKLVTVMADYVVISNVKASLLYQGEECVLDGVLVKITGSAGGLFNNSNSRAEFSSSSFAATGTELRALGSKIEWNGVLTTEATGLHMGEALEG